MFKEKRIHIFAPSNSCIVMVFAPYNGHILALFVRLTVQRYNKSLIYASNYAKKTAIFRFFAIDY
jgi:hypothetical protein